MTTDHINGQRFAVGITLEVIAGNEQLAIETARKAGRSLESESIVHGWINRQAEPLFNPQPFEQIKGQTAMETS